MSCGHRFVMASSEDLRSLDIKKSVKQYVEKRIKRINKGHKLISICQNLKPQKGKSAMSEMFPIMKYFEFNHLPEHLQAISKPFAELAVGMIVGKCDFDETTAGLRDLLRAKDCAVRARL